MSKNNIRVKNILFFCDYEESQCDVCPISLYKKPDYVFEQDRTKSSFFGTALDFTTKRIHFAVNGKWEMLDADACEHLFKSTLFPALSSAHGAVEMNVNLGQKEFRYPLQLSAPETNLSSVSIFPVSMACAGVSPLLQSAIKCDFDCYKLFEKVFVSKNVIKTDFATGQTLLHYLIRNCIRRSTEDWLSAVDRCIRMYGHTMSNSQDYDGRTPLMLASEGGVAYCLKLLLDAQATTELIDKVN